MTHLFLSDIGPSDELRELVAAVDTSVTTIRLMLDKWRVLGVVTKTYAKTTLIVQCRDSDPDQKVSVVLHLPYEPGSVGQATVLFHNPKEES